MNKVRFRYIKTGRAKYISQLDLTATIQRALIRAGIKLKYSEGFNPHPYISVAMPLQVGYESDCELVDVGLADDNLPDLNTIKFPEGILFTNVYKPVRKFNDIAWIKINGVLSYKNGIDNITDKIKKRFLEESIVITKKTKRGISDIDIVPYIKDIHISNENPVDFSIIVSAQNPSISFTDLENAFGDNLKPIKNSFKRIEMYDSNMVLFK